MSGGEGYVARFEVHCTGGEPFLADVRQLFAQFAASLAGGYPVPEGEPLTGDLAETWTGEVTGPGGAAYRIEERWFGGVDEYPQPALNFCLPWSPEEDRKSVV